MRWASNGSITVTVAVALLCSSYVSAMYLHSGLADALRRDPAFVQSVSRQLDDRALPSACRNATPNPVFTLPGDLTAHPAQSGEWWWYVGNVWSVDGTHQFGVHFGVARMDLLNLCYTPEESIWLLNFALSDLSAKPEKVHYWKSWVQSPLDPSTPVQFTTNTQNISQVMRGPDWSFTQNPKNPSLFTLEMNATADVSKTGGNSSASNGDSNWSFAVSLNLQMVTPMAVPMAFNGYELDGPTAENHFDEPTLIAVNPSTQASDDSSDGVSNRIVLTSGKAGQSLDVAIGVSGGGTGTDGHMLWNQHMWMTESKTSIMPWDWGNVHLSNGMSCAFQHFRFVENGTMNPTASYINCFNVPPPHQSTSILITGDEFTSKRWKEWRSPLSGLVYTVNCEYHIPKLDLTIKLEASMEDQELLMANGWLFYYEGSAHATASYAGDDTLTGWGYTEIFAPYQGKLL